MTNLWSEMCFCDTELYVTLWKQCSWYDCTFVHVLTEILTVLGASRTFEATDSDIYSTKILDQITPIPSSLELKVGAQVMLMKNLNVADGMVNGARGVVTSFDDKGRVSMLLH